MIEYYFECKTGDFFRKYIHIKMRQAYFCAVEMVIQRSIYLSLRKSSRDPQHHSRKSSQSREIAVAYFLIEIVSGFLMSYQSKNKGNA